MIKHLFNSQSETITSAAVILGAASLVSRLLGVFRDRILAGKFGAGDELDIYFAAFKVPDLVYNLLVVGALTAGFIPVFTSYLKRRKDVNTTKTVFVARHKNGSRGKNQISDEARYLASDVLSIVSLGLILICGLAAIFAKQIVPLIAPGFGPDKMSITISLTRIIFLSPIF